MSFLQRQQVKTGQMNPDHLSGHFSCALRWTPSWDVSWGVLEGLTVRALVGRSRGLVVPLVVPLVGPLVGQISLSPALCVAQSDTRDQPNLKTRLSIAISCYLKVSDVYQDVLLEDGGRSLLPLWRDGVRSHRNISLSVKTMAVHLFVGKENS